MNIACKNALFAGPNNVGYGTAKAVKTHMTRRMAAELGKDKMIELHNSLIFIFDPTEFVI